MTLCDYGRHSVFKKKGEVEIVQDPYSIQPPRWFLTDSTYEPESSDDKTKTRSIQHDKTFRERVHEGKLDLMTRRNNRIAEEVTRERKEKEQCRLLCCPAQNEHGDFCTCEFTSSKWFQRHQQSGKHKFPSVNTKTCAVRTLSDMSRAGAKFGLGTRINMNDVVHVRDDFVDVECICVFQHDSMSSSWFQPGCYNSKRKKTFRKTNSLKEDLERMENRSILQRLHLLN